MALKRFRLAAPPVVWVSAGTDTVADWPGPDGDTPNGWQSCLEKVWAVDGQAAAIEHASPSLTQHGEAVRAGWFRNPRHAGIGAEKQHTYLRMARAAALAWTARTAHRMRSVTHEAPVLAAPVLPALVDETRSDGDDPRQDS